MQGFSLGYPTNDPNVNRVIEETVSLVSDVDQRLQALKLGIAQCLPQLVPALIARDAALAQALRYGAIPGAASPWTTASPFSVPSLLPTISALPTNAVHVPFLGAQGIMGSPFASTTNPFLSAYNPYAAVPGVTGSPFFGGPFRLF